jgi:hypothetical protein
MEKTDVTDSLKSAYQAADDAYIAARMAGGDDMSLMKLDNARQVALLSFTQALQESLVHDNLFTRQLKGELDAVTTQLKIDMQSDQNASVRLGLVDTMVKLAGSLASAFA